MRLVIQRVSKASVTISNKTHGAINKGLLLLVGIEETDTHLDADWLLGKVLQMRIFGDSKGKMNLSVQDIGGEILVISQFTLFASTKKGNRPSFIHAAKPEIAVPLYTYFVQELTKKGILVQTGVFGADMQVSLINDGPVTIIIDSKSKE